MMLLNVTSLLMMLVLHFSFFYCTNKKTKSDYILNSKPSVNKLAKSDTIIYNIKPNSILLLNKDIDLQGNLYILPEGITIKQGEGLIKNGTLIGNKTKIETKGAIFEKVTISGTWNVPEISTSMFISLSHENSLKNVFALSNDCIQNTIYIAKGNYPMRVNKENQSCIKVKANTKVVLDGTIQLRPNQYKHYNIINIVGDNVHITGIGGIIGDKDKHIGTEGEWGMGLRFSKTNNSSVSGITIKDCWGDCIYVGGNSTNINIKECTLRNGRRQGISITSGKNIVIDKCEIHDVAGTNPMYAIDIEPNKKNIVDTVFISNVKTYNCRGGIICTRSTRGDSYIGYVEVSNCSVTGTFEKYSYLFKGAKTVVLKNCKGTGKRITFNHVDNVIVARNSISQIPSKRLYEYSRCKKIDER